LSDVRIVLQELPRFAAESGLSVAQVAAICTPVAASDFARSSPPRFSVLILEGGCFPRWRAGLLFVFFGCRFSLSLATHGFFLVF